MNAIRKAIESQYKGTCRVFEKQPFEDPITHTTKLKECETLTGQPCRLSYSSMKAVEGDVVYAKIQTIKLFIAPEIIIKPGSKIVVTQNGVTEEYARSGKPAIFTNHQEIILELFKGYA